MAGISTDFTPLSLRQRKYIEGVAQGMTRAEALRNAQYADSTRPSKVENTQVKAAFARLMRRAAPAHKIVKVIAEGLDATDTQIAEKKAYSDKGKIQSVEPELITSPNFRERREYAKLAATFGQYVDQDAGSSVQVAVGFTLINGVTRPK